MTASNLIDHLRSRSPTQFKERINNVIKASGNPTIYPIQAISANQLKSEDVATHTSKPEQVDQLLAHADGWFKCLGTGAHAIVPTYGVIVHVMRTRIVDMSNSGLVGEKIGSEDVGTIPDASITYAGWLTKAAVTKTASSLVVEFSRAEDAKVAIERG